MHGTGVAGLFKSVDRAFASACKTLGTAQLNRVLQQAVQATQPPMHQGRRIKPKFAHQGGKNPPLVIIHGNQVSHLPETYLRYLANAFRKAFRLEGTPVRIECREGENPYKEKKPKKTTIIVTRSIIIPIERIPATVNTIPCFKTVEGGIRLLGIGRFFVRSIRASISRSTYIFSSVEPEIAKNRPIINKINL